MEILISMIAFFALVVSWFMLPAAAKVTAPVEAALPDAIPTAA